MFFLPYFQLTLIYCLCSCFLARTSNCNYFFVTGNTNLARNRLYFLIMTESKESASFEGTCNIMMVIVDSEQLFLLST